MKSLLVKLLKYYRYKKYKKIFAKIGDNVIINKPFYASKPNNIYIENDVYIGNNAWISSYSKIIFKRGVIIGPRIKIYTGNHNYNTGIAIPYDDKTIAKSVIINENVWIGGDVIILPGVEIGEGSIIGAGSVVTKNVEPFSIMGGNPARKIKERNKDLYISLKNQDKIYLKLKSQGLIRPYIEIIK